MAKNNAYHLGDGDRAIFDKTLENPNYFTDFYFKNETTGIWWRPVEENSEVPEIQEIIEKWKRGYDVLWNKWDKLHRPESFEHKDRAYQVHFETLNKEKPVFHDHFGIILLPWQLELWEAKQTTRLIIGGYGSAKSWGEMLCNLIRMATLQFYRCFIIAPYGIQANEVFEQVRIATMGTEYYKRFLNRGSMDSGFTTKPFPKITVKNDQVFESTMNFFSLDHPEKILNLSGDAFHVVQAEQIDDLEGLLEIIGSRLRGQVAGRERLGIITYDANSDEAGNPQLWDMKAEADEDPKNVRFFNPWTTDNIYITPRQLMDIDRRMPKDPEKKDRALKGVQATGNGEHFSKININKCKSPMLDQMMEDGRKEKREGYILNTQPKAQVVDWCLPPDKTKDYLLVADPGWSNPPGRNSAGLMVFDITNFPHIPASLWAFSWVYGNNSPDPWLSKYVEFAETYKCYNRNAFDGTGLQGSGYEHKLHGLDGLNPWPVNLAGKKFIYLNAAKTLVSRGLFAFPRIPLLFSQMSNYRLPDDKLRQDLVMTVVIAAAYLDYMFFGFGNEDDVNKKREQEGRYPAHNREGLHTR